MAISFSDFCKEWGIQASYNSKQQIYWLYYTNNEYLGFLTLDNRDDPEQRQLVLQSLLSNMF